MQIDIKEGRQVKISIGYMMVNVRIVHLGLLLYCDCRKLCEMGADQNLKRIGRSVGEIQIWGWGWKRESWLAWTEKWRHCSKKVRHKRRNDPFIFKDENGEERCSNKAKWESGLSGGWTWVKKTPALCMLNYKHCKLLRFQTEPKKKNVKCWPNIWAEMALLDVTQAESVLYIFWCSGSVDLPN